MLPNCDCGACCESCGHDDGCIRFDLAASEEAVELVNAGLYATVPQPEECAHGLTGGCGDCGHPIPGAGTEGGEPPVSKFDGRLNTGALESELAR